MMILRLAPLKKNFYGFTHFDTPLTFAAFAACDKGYIMVGAMFRAFLATFLGGTLTFFKTANLSVKWRAVGKHPGNLAFDTWHLDTWHLGTWHLGTCHLGTMAFGTFEPRQFLSQNKNIYQKIG